MLESYFQASCVQLYFLIAMLIKIVIVLLFVYLFLANSELWSCKIAGCNGKGNKNSLKTNHLLSKDCPYEFESWNNIINGVIDSPDRLKPNDITKTNPAPVAR